MNGNHIGIEKPSIEGLKAYETVKKVSEYILEKKSAKDNESAQFGSVIFDEAKREYPELSDFSKNTFLQYLSSAVKDTESSINCLGKRQGYYLSEKAKEVEKIIEPEPSEMVDEQSPTTPQGRRQKEALLYPVLESWLITQGYQSSDVSSGRALGKWGNPDIAGISAIDGFHGLSIEVVTIEAKTSLESWEQWIFEAISHRRFANRSYFAFAHPEEAISKLPQDMRYYAELYNIGVLALSLENRIFDQLVNGELTTPLESDQVDVIEVYSAPYNFVQPKYQLKFCTALGISSAKELYQWGNR